MGIDKLVDSDMETTRGDTKRAYRRAVEPKKGIRVSKANGESESQILVHVKKRIQAHGGWLLRVEGGGVTQRISKDAGVLRPSQMKGAPDLLWLSPDFGFVAIELKSGRGGYVSMDQIRHLGEIIKAGGTSLVINTMDGLDNFVKEAAHGRFEQQEPFSLY